MSKSTETLEKAHDPDVKQGATRCEQCGAVLRWHNPGPYCSPCSQGGGRLLKKYSTAGNDRKQMV